MNALISTFFSIFKNYPLFLDKASGHINILGKKYFPSEGFLESVQNIKQE